jgi:hypothetical protein
MKLVHVQIVEDEGDVKTGVVHLVEWVEDGFRADDEKCYVSICAPLKTLGKVYDWFAIETDSPVTCKRCLAAMRKEGEE